MTDVQRKWSRGQMTVEMMVSIPVLISVALIAFNALSFMGVCAAFDAKARDAVRVYAAAPGYGQTREQCASAIRNELIATLDVQGSDIDVQVFGVSPGYVRYEAVLSYTPTLFGRSFSPQIFGVTMPRMSHVASLTIDPYKPGVFV